ncbi:MAG: hypothetical protein BWY85_02127 [Firmicutes bacterium ADurb.Bin506]|nr:MAG: hypothetical protein BWY85_02127 [Firmicutes bacterium ADurb.Bin506]
MRSDLTAQRPHYGHHGLTSLRAPDCVEGIAVAPPEGQRLEGAGAGTGCPMGSVGSMGSQGAQERVGIGSCLVPRHEQLGKRSGHAVLCPTGCEHARGNGTAAGSCVLGQTLGDKQFALDLPDGPSRRNVQSSSQLGDELIKGIHGHGEHHTVRHGSKHGPPDSRCLKGTAAHHGVRANLP